MSFRFLLACDVSEVAGAEVGVEPLLIDLRGLVLFLDTGEDSRVERRRELKTLEGLLAFFDVNSELDLFSVLKFCKIEKRGGPREIQLPMIRFAFETALD